MSRAAQTGCCGSRQPARAAWAFPPLALGLVTLSWITLLVWDASPYGRYLNHGDWTTIGLGAAMCAAVPGGSWLVPGLLYGGGWLLSYSNYNSGRRRQ